MTGPRIGFPPLADYFADAATTERDLPGAQPEWIALIHKIDHLWRSEVFGIEWTSSNTPPLLCYHSFSMWAAAARVALSGHAAAVYPLLRTAIEAACYAYVIARDPPLEKLWQERHLDREASRRAFSDVIKRVTKQLGEPLASYCSQNYQALIDFGAHPNVRGVQDYLSKGVEREDGRLVMSFAVINKLESKELVRSLHAVVDVGMVTMGIVTCVPDVNPRALIFEQLSNAMYRDEIAPLVKRVYEGPAP